MPLSTNKNKQVSSLAPFCKIKHQSHTQTHTVTCKQTETHSDCHCHCRGTRTMAGVVTPTVLPTMSILIVRGASR
jgi:hypothetical protein